MVALASVMSEDVVIIDDFVKGIIFDPCFLYEVYVKLAGFHGGNEMLISGIIMWVVGQVLPSRSRGQRRSPCAFWVKILLMMFPWGAGRGGAFLRWMVLGRWWRGLFAGEAGSGLELKEILLSMLLVHSGGAVSGRVDLHWVMGISSLLSLLVEWWHGLSIGGSGDRLKVEKMSLSTTLLIHLGGVVSCVVDLY